jgi:hypothetical protein
MIISRATPENTNEYCGRYGELLHKKLHKLNLNISASGFGSYRVDYRVREHFDSLEYAILNGINLIDSSSNYSDGGSEILIGNVLKKLIETGKIKREEIVVVTKGGYIQGRIYEMAQRKKERSEPFKEVVEYANGLWHSIHPEFLSLQISQSLERMQIETIDIYLLHNPEYFLDSSLKDELSADELTHEYYRRIKAAFGYLETEVDKGRIAGYGISSNSFVLNSGEQTFTSLEMCIKCAGEIKKDNHFYTVEFPLNLYERGALLNRDQKNGTATVLELAKESGLDVLVNRPLNAMKEKKLTRLADFETNRDYYNLDETQIITEINLLDSMEESFLKEYIDVLNLSRQNKDAVSYFLKAGQLLKENWKNFDSIENFNDVKKQFLIPRVNYAFSTMISSPNLTNEMKNKLDSIARQTNKLMSIIETVYGLMANTRSRKLHDKLNSLVIENESDQFKDLSLSQKSLLLLNSLDEISCTLIGMRQKKYVDDVLGSLKAKKIENAKKLLEKLEL